MTADFTREGQLIADGYAAIAGIDEVGRGPWAGPVVVAGVILDAKNIPSGLTDSKRISASRRQELAALIHQTAQVSIVEISVAEVDRLNILGATFAGMRRVTTALAPDFALIDGNKVPPEFPTQAEAIIKGDAKSASIAAASIVAKVHRDALMANLAEAFPGYGWETNAGYGTNAHKNALQNLGVTPHHRRSFKPIHNMLCGKKCG
ncbi:MAG: ribonuclease HII [Pseudomonadota bacterium]